MTQELPFACEDVFDLAADIERYPEFLLGWIAARIVRRNPEQGFLLVEQTLGFGPMRLQFASHAIMHRPERIDVTSDQAPFRRFNLTWLIERADHGCRVGVTAEVLLQSRLLQYGVDRVLPTTIDDTIAAFERRVRTLFQPRNGPPVRASGTSTT